MNKSAFSFLEDTAYAECLPFLQDFEQLFLLGPDLAGASLRKFWEKFTQIAIAQTGQSDAYQAFLSEKDCSNNLASRLRFMRSDERYCNELIDTSYTYTDQKRQTKKAGRFADGYVFPYKRMWLFDFFRGYANQFHHEDGQSARFNDPPYVVNFHQTLDYVTHLHRYLLAFFGVASKPIDFRRMPLCQNNGQTVFYMHEELLTGMNPLGLSGRYSFTGTMYPDKNKEESYPVIIQLFDKNDPTLPQVQLERCAATYAATRRSKFGEALRDIRVLSGYHASAEFYILVYIFEEPANALTAELLRDVSIEDRLILCREIASIISDLHNARPAIYHRLLNHHCIWLCRNFDGISLYPAIIGFSFAKIKRENQPTVLVGDTKQRIASLNKTDTTQYIPVGWEVSAGDFGDQVDVYSLGILFTNILAGKFNLPLQINANNPINKYFPTIRTALTQAPDEFTALVIKMLDPIGLNRPSASEVHDTLCRICG